MCTMQLFVVCGPFFNLMGGGCCMSFSAPLLPLIMDPSSDLVVTGSIASWIASIIVIGSLTGTAVGPFVVARLGRKRTQLISTIPPLIGWYGIGCAHSATVILVAKLLQGFGSGVAFVISAVYVGEISAPKYRGAFTSCTSFGVAMGILSGHFVGSLFPWRTAAIICSIFHVITFVVSLFSTESPCWLISKNKFDESGIAFRWLRGDGEAALKEFNAMVLAQKIKSTNGSLPFTITCGRNFFEHMTRGAFYKPFLVTAALSFFFHCTGVDVILNVYCIIILKQLLDDTDGDINHQKIMLSFDIIKLVACVLAIYLIKVFNRRTFILSANLLVITTLVLLFIFSYLKALHVTIFYSNWIFIGLLSSFAFFMNVGIMSLLYPIVGEIFLMVYKPISISLLGLMTSCMLFGLLKFAPAMFAGLGLHGTFLVYAFVGAICTLYVYYCLPETRGKTLQEIEEYFTGEVVDEAELKVEMDRMMHRETDGDNK